MALDPDRELNNGRPYVHARWIDRLEPAAGEHIVHVGAGTGYYSAILARIVGPTGRIIAIEADAALCALLRVNVADLPQVEVIEASGVGVDFGPTDGFYVNAGLTNPQPSWLDRLRIASRMILPLTARGAKSFGAVLWIRRLRGGFEARSWSRSRISGSTHVAVDGAGRKKPASLGPLPEVVTKMLGRFGARRTPRRIRVGFTARNIVYRAIG